MNFLNNVEIRVNPITPVVNGTPAYLAAVEAGVSEKTGKFQVNLTLETRDENGGVTGRSTVWVKDPTDHKKDLQTAKLVQVIGGLMGEQNPTKLMEKYPELTTCSSWDVFAEKFISLLPEEYTNVLGTYKLVYRDSQYFDLALGECFKLGNYAFKLGKDETWTAPERKAVPDEFTDNDSVDDNNVF